MSYKKIEFLIENNDFDAIKPLMTNDSIISYNHIKSENNSYLVNIILPQENTQHITDLIRKIIGVREGFSIVISTIDTIIPKPISKLKDGDELIKAKTSPKFLGTSREELLDIVSRGVNPDKNFIMFVILSTIVAAIGLLEDNVAVVIGAMVIAPLLGPNLALAFSTALGDVALARKSLKTNIIGFITCYSLAFAIGYFWQSNLNISSHELDIRTTVSYDSVVLAIASGTVAVLSLTSGISSVMVGVMVAVALLPPATTSAIMLGAGKYEQAYNAFLLLAVNIVCVNLAAKVTLLIKGIRPRTWYQQKIAKKQIFWYLVMWVIALIALLAVIYLKYPRVF